MSRTQVKESYSYTAAGLVAEKRVTHTPWNADPVTLRHAATYDGFGNLT